MRTTYNRQLEKLQSDLVAMGKLCRHTLKDATIRLTEKDEEHKRDVLQMAREIENLEHRIERRCLKLLLHQQPVASDLRRVSATLKMVYDMKRIGAQSSEIYLILQGASLEVKDDILLLRQMVEVVRDMVEASIHSYVSDSPTLAKEVIAKDQQVNSYFDTIKVGLGHYFNTDNHQVDEAIAILMVSKYLERIGDHAVNISQWALFALTGQLSGDEK